MDSRGRTKLDMLPYGSREECKGLTGSLPGVGAGTRDKDGGDTARASAPNAFPLIRVAGAVCTGS